MMLSRNFFHTFAVKLRGSGPRLHVVSNGAGSHPILCIPGALGTAITDFAPQLKHFGADGTGFTAISFDPRGYGQSKPPKRTFQTKPVHFLEQDAIDGHHIMLELGFTKYSVLGWSDGGVVGMKLACRYPESVKNLVIWGANAYVSKEDIELFEKTRDVNNWSTRMREPMEAIYGANFALLWSEWIDSMIEVYNRNDGDLCREQVPLIKCRTLILHGEKDPIVPPFHPKYLLDNIKGAQLHTFPEGKHNIHLKFSEEFNSIVKNFIV